MKVVITFKNPANHENQAIHRITNGTEYITNKPLYITPTEFMTLTQDFDIDVEVIDMNATDPDIKEVSKEDVEKFLEDKSSENEPIQSPRNLAEDIASQLEIYDTVLDQVETNIANRANGEEYDFSVVVSAANLVYKTITRETS